MYVTYIGGARLARALPERPAYLLAHWLGEALAMVPTRNRAVVARNLARVTGAPEGSARLRRVVRASYRSYARYWLETFRYAQAPAEFFLERFTCRKVEHLDDIRRRHGGAAIAVVAHLGNWDAAGAWCGASGRSAATVAEVLRPRRLFDFFSEHRRRLGMTIYPATSGVTAVLVDELRAGKLVALLGDRDLRGRGPEVDFFGERARFPLGPASLAARTGVPIVVAGVYSVRRPDGSWGWEAEMSEPIEPPPDRTPAALVEVTQRVAWAIERFVARKPEDWHVWQPIWSADRVAGGIGTP